MAGVKGKSGGARPNSGGKRPGAGRKPAPPVFIPPVEAGDEPDSIKLLRQMVNDAGLDAKLRLDAAKALAPFEAVKRGDAGKKEERKQAAKKAGAGRFASGPPPLRVVGGK